jgi:membrane protein required for colicin V production
VNFLDITIVLLCLGFAVAGIIHGVVRQLFSWTGILLGHIIGVKYCEIVQEKFLPNFPHSEIVSYLLIFIVIYLAIHFVGLLIEQAGRGSRLSGADRAVGMLAGFVKGVLFSILLVFVLVILLPAHSRHLRESALVPRAVVVATWVAKIFPAKMHDSFQEKAGDYSTSASGGGGA